MNNSLRPRIWVCVLVWVLVLVTRTAAAQYQDFRVQPPTLGAPERGSVAGQLANANFGPADVSRGAFSLPSPFTMPTERGESGLNPFPTYSPDSGLSEWGIGWRASLAIERWQPSGDVNYSTDLLRGPWGTMVRGADGAWYVEGLKSRVRVVEQSGLLVAYLEDGSTWTFGEGSARIDTAAGTFAWHVTRIDSVLGRRTTLTYRRNRSGRPYLFEVGYGGTQAQTPQERVLFDYVEATPVRDYRSGELRWQDKRVSAVRAQSRSATNGSWVDRWRYSISYRASTVGVGYYIEQIQQIFASGEAMPPFTYRYATVQEHLANVTARRATKLDGLFGQFGPGIVSGEKSANFDDDEDGRVDFEIASDNSLYQQTDTGFVAAPPLPPHDPTGDPRCRRAPDPFRQPRNLVRMLKNAPETNVAYFDTQSTLGITEIGVCDRAGRVLSSTKVTGSWAPGPNVKFVDLNRDRLPDIVRVEDGRILVLQNTSTDTTLSFVAGPTSLRSPIVNAEQIWVADFNGDGLADVVSRNGAAFRVAFGLGNYRFTQDGFLFQLITRDGFAISDFSDTQVTLFDANKDGLIDLLRMTTSTSTLYVNDGAGYFRETPALAVSAIGGWGSNFALPLDVEGTGNTEILFTKNNLAMSLALDAPAIGLLTSANDGKGTVLEFTYKRSTAVAGVPKRDAVLASMLVRSVGISPITYSYDYAGPTLHSRGRFLIGYGDVTRTIVNGSERMTFLNDDRYAGVLLTSEQRDAKNPAAIKVELRDYEDATSFGIPWKRLALQRTGFAPAIGPPGPGMLATVRTTAYANEICPARVERDEGHGLLVNETAYTTPQAFAGHLSCLPQNVRWTGRHTDVSLDFASAVHVARSSTGQLTALTLRGSGGDIVDETITYDADNLARSITSAGRGTTSIDYEPGTAVVRAITAPDGSRISVSERDPVSAAIRALVNDRGGLVFVQNFRYDGLERLVKAWSNAGTASETAPNLAFAYRYADAITGLPALVRSDVLVNAAGSSAIVKHGADLSDARGTSLSTASWMPSGWLMGPLQARDPGERTTTSWQRPQAASDIASLTVSELFAGAQFLASETGSAFGFAADSRGVVQTGVERVVRSVLAADAALTLTQIENDELSTTATLDALQRVVAFRDQAGTISTYVRDALGRVRGVVLPDGSHHRVAYDDYGRISTVERDGVARIEYAYFAGSSLLSGKRWRTPGTGSKLVRSAAFAYDGAGRLVTETDTDAASGESSTYNYYFDGATPAAPAKRDRLGLLTGVAGEGYTKTYDYYVDGAPAKIELELTGFGAVRTTFEHEDDGSPRSRSRTILGPEGETLSSVSERMTKDAYGRIATISLQGNPFATIDYDTNGLVASASFSGPLGHGEKVSFTRDPLTRKRMGIRQMSQAWNAVASMRMNARGVVDDEQTTLGTTSVDRSFGYSPEGYVVSASDAEDTYGYGYDATGLITRSTRVGASSSHNAPYERRGDTLYAGEVVLRFDAMGRVVQRNAVTLRYGANGQIRDATAGGRTFRYLYDEAGHRIAKLEGVSFVALYPEDGSIVDASYRLTEPALVAGQIVGVYESHAGTLNFKLLPVDARGTLYGDVDGTLLLASPYGARDSHPRVSAAVDYVTKGYDADLGMVRIGVRDYDPDVARFAQPDPLFLESVDACAGNPVGCNLYGYARNNPLAYVDPAGTDPGVAPGVPAQPAWAPPAAPASDVMLPGSSNPYAWQYYPASKGSPVSAPGTATTPLRAPGLATRIGTAILGGIGSLLSFGVSYESDSNRPLEYAPYEDAPEAPTRIISETDAARQYAHDIGEKLGRAKALEMGLIQDIGMVPYAGRFQWSNPFSDHGPYGQGFDDVMQLPNGDLAIVEYKGGTSTLTGNQMGREWVKGNIDRLLKEGGAAGTFWGNLLKDAVSSGRLWGFTFSTPIADDGIPGQTKVTGQQYRPDAK